MSNIRTRGEGVERRLDERFHCSVVATLREISHLSGTANRGQPIMAIVENVSQTGICVTTRTALLLSTSVRCELQVDDLAVAVPTLAQVRWVAKKDSRTYQSGLRYLF